MSVKLPAEEKQEVLALLSRTRDEYVAALDSVPVPLHDKCVGQESWSPLQCAEHVVNSEEGMFKLWEKLAQPGTSDRATDEAIRTGLANRSNKRVAPERVRPLGRIQSLAEARERFILARNRTIALVIGIPAEELRGKVVPHPLVGAADGYQLFHIMAMHSARHAIQINETARQVAALFGGTE
jgi:hypothetical protein